MNSQELKTEIEKVFPFINKPKGITISFHKDSCCQCRYLREDLEKFNGRELSPEAIRQIHQEMSCLSAAGWRWVLPSYLRYSITEAAEYSKIETEFLIYNLSPELKYQPETIQRLSALSKDQILCLLHFLEWCKQHKYWGEYCQEEICSGINFLMTLRINSPIDGQRQ